MLTHNIGNVTTANAQQIGSATANIAGQLVSAGTSVQHQQIGRKSRVRKRSKSPDIQQQVQSTQQPQTILIQNQNQAAIVSLQQTSSGNYIPVSGVQTVSTSGGGQQQTVITGDDSDTDRPSKICKTETASASPASSASGISGTNNAGSVTTVAAPGTAIVTQIVVARDGKDKNMTSLGMGMVSTYIHTYMSPLILLLFIILYTTNPVTNRVLLHKSFNFVRPTRLDSISQLFNYIRQRFLSPSILSDIFTI